MLSDAQRIALLPKVVQKGKEPVTQVWLTQSEALSYSERIEAAACEDRDKRIAELVQTNKELQKEVDRLMAAHESTVNLYSLASRKS